MMRMPKQDNESVSAAQARSTSKTRNDALACGIDNSPTMETQRKKLNTLFGDAIQRIEADEDLSRGKSAVDSSVQRQEESAKSNNTGLPDNLKNGIEALSGVTMDNVRVHYNSSAPAQLNALAYAQGTDIHVAPGQEQHLPHEAWHVVQQAQGRVKPTMQMKEGVPVNDDESLEHEADVMGAKALQMAAAGKSNSALQTAESSMLVLQGKRWQNSPAKFRTENGVEGVPESEYLVSANGYKRFAPINEFRAPGQVFHEGPRSFAYLENDSDAGVANNAIEADCVGNLVTLTDASDSVVEANRVPANGYVVWDADVSEAGDVGERHVGHPVKNLGAALPTLESAEKTQEERYKQHAVKKGQEAGDILSDDELIEVFFQDAFANDKAAHEYMKNQPDIADPIRKAQQEGKTKLEIVEELAQIYGWSGRTITEMASDEELDERAKARIENQGKAPPSYIS